VVSHPETNVLRNHAAAGRASVQKHKTRKKVSAPSASGNGVGGGGEVKDVNVDDIPFLWMEKGPGEKRKGRGYFARGMEGRKRRAKEDHTVQGAKQLRKGSQSISNPHKEKKRKGIEGNRREVGRHEDLETSRE